MTKKKTTKKRATRKAAPKKTPSVPDSGVAGGLDTPAGDELPPPPRVRGQVARRPRPPEAQTP